MKKFKSAVVSGLVTLAAFAPLASFAVEGPGGITSIAVPKGETVKLQALVERGMGIAFGILLVLAGVFVFAAAFYYLTSATDEKRRDTAKKLIIYSVVAVIVAAVSQGIIYVVTQFLIITP